MEHVTTTEEKTKSHLLTDNAYQRLTEGQRQINETSGFSPSMRTILNEAITIKAVEHAKQRIKEKLALLNELTNE